MYAKLRKKIKNAMLTKDKETLSMARSLKSKVEEYMVANRMDRELDPDDETIVTVLQAHKKSLEKAVAQLEKGGDRSADLCKEYNMEIELCNEFLPSLDDQKNKVAVIVNLAIEEFGPVDAKSVGKLIGQIMKNNEGLDGKLVRSIIMEKIKE